jgi:hypothetical protein
MQLRHKKDKEQHRQSIRASIEDIQPCPFVVCGGGGARLLSNLRLVLVFRYVVRFFIFVFLNYQS